MKFNVIFLSEAESDIDKAYIWYESKQLDLGYSFYKKIEEAVNYISNNPFVCEEVYKGIRRFVIKKFPYGLYFKINLESKDIQIIGVIHFKRSTRVIKSRKK